ncbi:MAG TPA: DoxX family protein [Thermoanaerobaculia bacterium]|jgi:putative oxidoreductase|nr:DoxX family protein [Thermoanaerobaculia bacterium]
MPTASTPSARDDIGKLILRLTVAVLLAFHGFSKLKNGIGWMAGPLHAHHLPTFLGYGVYVAEVVAPVLLILGILTRPAALVIAFDLFMALVLVVQGKAFQLTPQGGGLGAELQFLYLFSALALAFFGGGRFSISKGRGRWN